MLQKYCVMNLGAVFFCWQFDMQFSYATHLAHPVLCRPTHLNISGYASGSEARVCALLRSARTNLLTARVSSHPPALKCLNWKSLHEFSLNTDINVCCSGLTCAHARYQHPGDDGINAHNPAYGTHIEQEWILNRPISQYGDRQRK